MSDIAPVGHSSIEASSPVSGASSRYVQDVASVSAGREGDQVEVSPLAKYLHALREIEPFRSDLVSSVRDALASGTYESEDRLNGAIDAIFEEEPGLFE